MGGGGWWVVGGVVALGSGSSQSSVVCFGSGPSLQRSNQKIFSCGALGCVGGRWSGDGQRYQTTKILRPRRRGRGSAMIEWVGWWVGGLMGGHDTSLDR